MNIRATLKTSAFFALLSTIPWNLMAQGITGQTHTFSLKECLEYAYEHQDSLKNARLDMQNADYVVKETNALGFPQISASANLLDYLKIPAVSFNGSTVRFGTKYQSTLGISVSQLLFDGGYIVGLQGTKVFKELSVRNYDRTKVATSIAVTKAYYQVLVSDEQLKLLDANVAQLKQQLAETTELNKQGFVEKIDTDRLTVLYNNLVTTRNNTIQLLSLGKQVLKFQIGMPIGDELIINEKIQNVQLEPVSLLAADTTAYKNRVEYNLLETSVRLNAIDVKLSKSDYLPKLNAVGNTGLQYLNNSFGQLYSQSLPSTYIGVQLSIPIFDGFQKKYRIKQREVTLYKSQNTLHGVKNAINLQIDQARILYSNGMESLNNQRRNMDLAREVLRVSKIKYEQGVGSSIEVTQAQTALQEAENNYIQSLYNALISKVDLDAAYGNIK